MRSMPTLLCLLYSYGSVRVHFVGWKNCSIFASATSCCCSRFALLFQCMCVICGSRYIYLFVHVVMVVDWLTVSLLRIYPGVVLFSSLVWLPFYAYIWWLRVSGMCALISTVIPVLQAMVPWCALPALSYLLWSQRMCLFLASCWGRTGASKGWFLSSSLLHTLAILNR